MRKTTIILAVIATALAVATSAFAALNPNRFDGVYHLNAPAIPGRMTESCPATATRPARSLTKVLPVPATNITVRNGVTSGKRIQGSATFGHVWITAHQAVAGGTVTVTFTVSFSTHPHTVSWVMHEMGKVHGCAVTGGFTMTGHRIRP